MNSRRQHYKTLQVRLSGELRDQLNELSKQEDRSSAWEVRQAIAERIERQRKSQPEASAVR